MKIKISYSEIELKETTKFIYKNNFYLEESEDEIREAIISSMKDLASHKDQNYLSTMGFILVVDYSEEESLDNDENIVYIKMYIDPALKYLTDGLPDVPRIEFTIDVPATEYWKELDD